MAACTSPVRRMALGALLVAASISLAACAGFGSNPRDPLEPFNRKAMAFNENVDAVVLKPSATFYREKIPAPVRTGVANFFGNLTDVWSAVNSLLQFKFQDAADNWTRFSLNSLFGVFGIFDIASDLNIERHREDFGQTLGRWGVPAGPFVMLPLLGPSTVRDTFALPVDRKGNPITYSSDHATPRNSLYVLKAVDTRANLLRASNVLDEVSLDKYSFIRDSYLQRRRAEIFEGGEGSEDPNAGSDAEPAEPAKPSR